MDNKYISLNVLDSMEHEIVEGILNQRINVLCKNFDTEQQKNEKLDELYKKNGFFWRNNSDGWTYYILERDLYNNEVQDKTKKAFNGFTDNYTELIQMSDEKRIEALEISKDKLKVLELKRTVKNEEISEALVSSSTDSIMLNKVIFDDLMKMTPDKAKLLSKKAVKETSEIVKIASRLLEEFSGDFTLFSNIIEKSNGSTIQHMTRVFIMSLGFFQYYNKLMEKGHVSKIRVAFDNKYRSKYEKLLPNVNFHLIKLEKIFKGGMSSISNLERNAISVGFLLHDIGKQVDLEYFEGSEGYQKDRIQAHVTNGFNELLKRTSYPPVVSAIAGFHHEYYGHGGGYGPLRDYLNRKYPDGISPEYCISYSLHDVYEGKALSFFPAKILEIVDVYDALTDPGRKYRDPLTQEGAIDFMREHFLQDEIKVDPILFDIFVLYLEEEGKH